MSRFAVLALLLLAPQCGAALAPQRGVQAHAATPSLRASKVLLAQPADEDAQQPEEESEASTFVAANQEEAMDFEAEEDSVEDDEEGPAEPSLPGMTGSDIDEAIALSKEASTHHEANLEAEDEAEDDGEGADAGAADVDPEGEADEDVPPSLLEVSLQHGKKSQGRDDADEVEEDALDDDDEGPAEPSTPGMTGSDIDEAIKLSAESGKARTTAEADEELDETEDRAEDAEAAAQGIDLEEDNVPMEGEDEELDHDLAQADADGVAELSETEANDDEETAQVDMEGLEEPAAEEEAELPAGQDEV